MDMGREERVTLREVVGRFAGEVGKDGMGEEELRRVLEEVEKEVECLRRGDGGLDMGVSMEEMIVLSGLDEETFTRVYLSWVDGEYLSFSPLLANNVIQSMQSASNSTSALNMSSQRPSASYIFVASAS